MARCVRSHPDWLESPSPGTNWLEHGQMYFQWVQALLPCACRLDLDSTAYQRQLLWIGQHVHRLNQQLDRLTQSCRECFFDNTCPDVQTWAFPLDWALAADSEVVGLCSLKTTPAALVIDVGQIHPDDWLGVVAHEFAHAISGAGHGLEFQNALNHLCIGLGLPPPKTLWDEQILQQWPPYRPVHQPKFWQGEAT